jgi:hypothetical protein
MPIRVDYSRNEANTPFPCDNGSHAGKAACTEGKNRWHGKI